LYTENASVYTFVTSSISIIVKTIFFSIFQISIEILLYKNCFSETDISLLSEYNKNNYTINLQSDTKLLFKFLYILSEKEFAVFRDYLLENQISKYICKFTSYANISILFVFKKNSIFRLCINYRELNSIIIKNKYLLFFIEKTLNRLIDIYYFIKFDLKNIYYCICIQKKDK